jgi:hypothetical protein
MNTYIMVNQIREKDPFRPKQELLLLNRTKSRPPCKPRLYMRTVVFSVMTPFSFVGGYQRRHNPYDHNSHFHRLENLKSHRPTTENV